MLELFGTFLRIGLFTFGGGYAMIPIIEDQCVEKKKWITHEEMMDAAVIAESTPGPIAINVATMVGWQQGAFGGLWLPPSGLCCRHLSLFTPFPCFWTASWKLK